MIILDQPIEEAPQKKWTMYEMIALSLFVLTSIISVVGNSYFSQANNPSIRELFALGPMLTGTFLGASYLFGYYWIDKPPIATARTVIVSIFYGVSFCCGTFSLIFIMITSPGAPEMSILGFVIFSLTLLADYLLSIKKQRVASKFTYIRAGVFIIVLFILNLVSN